MFVFVSYSHGERDKAAEVHTLLSRAGIDSFMAHEHIGVSKQWRDEIMAALAKCDAFLCILSKQFFTSEWCVQETGIASFRNVPIIPLSLDGSIPKGSFSHIQSTKLATPISWRDLAPGFATFMPIADLIDLLIKWSSTAPTFRDGEARIETLMPYLNSMTVEQLVRLLVAAGENGQIWDAKKCKSMYLPKIFERYDELTPFEGYPEELRFIRDVIE